MITTPDLDRHNRHNTRVLCRDGVNYCSRHVSSLGLLLFLLLDSLELINLLHVLDFNFIVHVIDDASAMFTV